MKKPITIKEIAKKANVSIGTVDRVLHNRGRVADETREKVLKIAKDGNYSSNVLARHLKLNKTYTIQVILPKENSYWEMLRGGIEDGRIEYERMGFTTKYFFLKGNTDQSDKMELNQILDSNVDGFIIAPSVFQDNEDLLLKLKNNEKPYVFVDSKISASGYLSYIGQNAFKSGILAARLLHDKYLPSYNIFIITFWKSALKENTVINRIDGFRKFFKDNNIANVHISEVNFEQDNLDLEKIYHLFSHQTKPVHIFIPNSKSHLLANTLTKLKNSIQIRVVGYDLLPSNLELLNNDSIDFLIHQKPQLQGYLGIQSLYKHLVLKTDVSENQFMPIDIITKENMMYCQ